MANEQWPSEDEDFDAVTSSSTATATEAPAPAAPKAVTVSMPDDDKDEEEPAPAEEPKEEKPAPAPAPAPKPAAVAPAPAASEPPAPPKPTVSSAPGEKRSGHIFLDVILVILIIGLALWSWTLYSDRSDLRQQVDALKANPQVAVQKQTQDLISKVGKLYNLPNGETPTIANVTDAAAAKKQSAFFNNAQKGDKVLMYVKAGVAILYRPSTNKIILVAPLTFTNSDATASATPTPTPTATPKH
jgi:hypothetical protein